MTFNVLFLDASLNEKKRIQNKLQIFKVQANFKANNLREEKFLVTD
jgi:hypothetical protein